MAFELEQGERIPKGVRRIACKRIDKALKALKGVNGAVTDSAIHEARQRFKEIRGTLRLVRDELGGKVFRRENRTFRDAGRPLSALRDAKVLVDSLDGLIAHFDGRVKRESAAKLRRRLLERRRETREQVIQRDRAVSGIIRRIGEAKKRVKDWPLRRRGWKAIEGGLRRAYALARRATKDVRAGTSDERLHECRKRTKDLRYELELIQFIWPETLTPLAEQCHRLTDLLGDDHDLAVLRTVAQEEIRDDPAAERELLFALIDERRDTLQKQATALGERLYEERAQEFVRRLKGYWDTARRGSK